MLPFLLQGLLLGGTAAAQPGPLQAYLLSLTTNYGWRRAIPSAFAPLISDGPIVLLVLLVLTTVPEVVLRGLQIAGGLFLMYLAFGAWRNFKEAATVTADAHAPARESLLKGVLINLLSPNPYIFWTTLAGPIFINGWREAPRNGLGFLIGFYVALIGGFIAFIALVDVTGKIDMRLNRFLSGASAVALLIFGLFQFGTGILQLAGD